MAGSLDDYRAQIVAKLRVASGPNGVRALLAEVHLMLAGAKLSKRARSAFWESLKNDLDVLAEDYKGLLGKDAASALGAVLAAAHGAIGQYQRLLKTDMTGGDR
jgi:hypothetical protein